MTIVMEPIAYVQGGRRDVRDDGWGDNRSTIELVPGLPEESLDGIGDFSHAEILFVFDRVSPDAVVLGARHPRGNTAWPAVGIFAQRGRNRPNRLGATIVRITGRDGPRLHVEGLDAVEGTPILDIKPVLAEFLPREPVRQPQWSHELMRDYWTPGAEGETPGTHAAPL